jgi:hypothetical protein
MVHRKGKSPAGNTQRLRISRGQKSLPVPPRPM